MPKSHSLSGYLFDWSYASPYLFFALAGAISVVALNQFTLGYSLMTIAGIGLIAHWWRSERIVYLRGLLEIRSGSRLCATKRRYYAELLGGTSVLFILMFAGLYWVHYTQ